MWDKWIHWIKTLACLPEAVPLRDYNRAYPANTDNILTDTCFNQALNAKLASTSFLNLQVRRAFPMADVRFVRFDRHLLDKSFSMPSESSVASRLQSRISRQRRQCSTSHSNPETCLTDTCFDQVPTYASLEAKTSRGSIFSLWRSSQWACVNVIHTWGLRTSARLSETVLSRQSTRMPIPYAQTT